VLDSVTRKLVVIVGDGDVLAEKLCRQRGTVAVADNALVDGSVAVRTGRHCLAAARAGRAMLGDL
jgi:predicted O-methyltransferase YrrM